MKLQVITNPKGQVLGTYKSTPEQAGAPIFSGFTASKEHHVHEIDVPDGDFNIKDTTEFHKAVEKHVNKK